MLKSCKRIRHWDSDIMKKGIKEVLEKQKKYKKREITAQ